MWWDSREYHAAATQPFPAVSRAWQALGRMDSIEKRPDSLRKYGLLCSLSRMYKRWNLYLFRQSLYDSQYWTDPYFAGYETLKTVPNTFSKALTFDFSLPVIPMPPFPVSKNLFFITWPNFHQWKVTVGLCALLHIDICVLIIKLKKGPSRLASY